METIFTEDLDDSLALDLIVERGEYSHGVGERAVAASGRIVGPDKLQDLMRHLRDSFSNRGLTSVIRASKIDLSHDEGAAGREWALHGSAVDIQLTLSCKPDTDPEQFRHDVAMNIPDEALETAQSGGELGVTLRYLSSGQYKSGWDEAKEVLQQDCVEIVE